jgi:sorbitol-specific phosphotransferase system component IIC
MGNITPNSQLFISLQLVTAAITNYIKNRRIERHQKSAQTSKILQQQKILLIINLLATFLTKKFATCRNTLYSTFISVNSLLEDCWLEKGESPFTST